MKKHDKNNKLKLVIIITIIIIVIFLLCIFIYNNHINNIKKDINNNINKNINKNIVIEYGNSINKSDILLYDYDAIFNPSLDTIKDVGDYKVNININNYNFNTNIKIQDTIPPKLEVKDITIYSDEDMPKVNDFVVSSSDLSDVYYTDINIDNIVGTQDINITAYDLYNNETTKISKLTILEDKTPPIISGLTNITIYVNERYDLKKDVKSIDDRFGEVVFSVDDSNIDYSKPGTYKIKYTSSDKLGNTTTKYRNITIKIKDITYMINNFPTYRQYPNYPTGCEIIALYTLLRYYKINVFPDELVSKLKKGDIPYKENDITYGGDPEREFLGDPKSLSGWGVYQKPIIDVAREYKSGIIDYSNHSFNDVLS